MWRETMGRPIGSPNRQKPFADALRMEICAGNDHRVLRALARKLIEKGLEGDLAALREIGDRLDGRPAQIVERGDVPLQVLSDGELYAIIRGEPLAPIDGTNGRLIGPPDTAK
jgi:hypothetical protein